MRKVPVLTVVVALCALVAAPSFSATGLANDPPGFSLMPGANAPDAFKLSDFFADPAGAAVSSGGSVANDLVTVDGLAAAGQSSIDIANGGGASGSAPVWVSGSKFSNRPEIDNNNRLVGVAGGNMFANFVAGGGSVSSAMPLGNPGGGTVSPGGGSPGGAALAAVVGTVSVSQPAGRWYQRTTSVGGSTVTASIDAAGAYSITVPADADAALVSFMVAGVDAVNVLAAPAVAVGAPVTGSRTVAAAGVDFQTGAAISVTPGQVVQIELVYNASSVDGVAIAAIGFDGVLAFEGVSYSNPSGAALQAGADKKISTSVIVTSGSLIPGVQVANGGSAAVTVDIKSFVVAMAAPLTDYALDPNWRVVNNSLDSADGIIDDILQAGAAASSVADGQLVLNGSGGFSNGSITATLNRGTAVAEAYVTGTSGGGNVTLNVTDGGPVAFQANVPGSAVNGTVKIQCSGTVQADGTAVFITVQAAGIDVTVDDLSVRMIKQGANQFDGNLM